MIKVSKSKDAPQSLLTANTYDGEDVKRQLIEDQNSKCYLCERHLTTDFEIEHFKSKDNYPELIKDWNNLLLACRYCNSKKSNNFDNLLNPLTVNIEEDIKQEVDFINQKAIFTLVQSETELSKKLIELLQRLFNGSTRIRKIKEEQFFEYFISVINRFQKTVNNYLLDATEQTENEVRAELGIDKEFLGFKYWIIKNNPILNSIFSKDIVWNK
jgi:uncharacterized protein (TIGR02646 family)